MTNDWIKETVIYEIFPRVFSEKGNFRGIIGRLPRLQELGVTTLWLMPVQKIGKINRKGTLGSPYSICDYCSINPDLGSENDFKELVESAHSRNMRLIIDWVAMYTAWDNDWLKKHPGWYRKNEAGEIVAPNDDWVDVAHLNYADTDLHDGMIDAMSYWLKKFDIDGFRCDTAGNMFGLVPTVFWRKAIKQLRKIKPGILMLAEWESPDFHINAFDLTYSWALYHLLRKIKENEKDLRSLKTVDSVQIPWTQKGYKVNPGTRGAGFIHELLQAQKKEFPDGALRMRIIENHDEPRAAASFGKDASRAYATLIFTIDGVPLLYNGQEIGEEERPSHFEPVKINWKNGDDELRNFYKKLIGIRKENPVLHLGGIKKIRTGCDENVYAFCREYKENTAVVVINFSTRQQTVGLKFPQKGNWMDLLGGKTITKIGPTILQLTPYASHIFVKK